MGRPLAKIEKKPTTRQLDRSRASIQVTKILASLQSIALGETRGDPARIRACGILLNKVMPDLSSMTVAKEPEPPALSYEEAREKMIEMGLERLRAMPLEERRALLEDDEEAEVITLRPSADA